MSGVAFQNRNRGHAVKQLKKYMNAEDEIEGEKHFKAACLNAFIFFCDCFEDIAKAMNPASVDSRRIETIEEDDE